MVLIVVASFTTYFAYSIQIGLTIQSAPIMPIMRTSLHYSH